MRVLTYCSQVTHGNAQSDGEWGRPVEVATFGVDRRKDGEDEHKRHDQLDTESLRRCDVTSQIRLSQRSFEVVGCDTFEEERAEGGTCALRQDEEERTRETDVARHKHRHRHSRVDVTSTHVTNRPDDRRNDETEAESNLCDARRVIVLPTDARAAPDEDEKEGAKQLGEDGAPEEQTAKVVETGRHCRGQTPAQTITHLRKNTFAVVEQSWLNL